MASVNKVFLIGNLGRDPEVKYLPSGQAVANMSVATSEAWNDKSTGEKNEKTTWHVVVAWGKTAEFCGQYLAKGATVVIEGSIQVRDYQGRDGDKRKAFEIKADRIQGIGGRRDAGPPSDERAEPRGNAEPAPSVDDIPF